MWWKSQHLRDDLISVLKDEIAVLRHRHQTDCERVDRLMEALARRANIDLVMPMPSPPPIERISVPNPWKDPNPVSTTFKETQ